MTQENIKNMLSPNKEDMRKHIEFIMHGMDDYKDGLIEVSYGDEQNNPTISRLFSAAEENIINKIIEFCCEKNSMGRNVYIVPSYQDPWSSTDKRGSSDQFYATNTIAIDVDNDGPNPLTAAELKIKYAHCRPGMVIVTGRKPNLRTWLIWKLTEPLTDKIELRNIVTGIIDNLNGDPAAKDATRLTRLGGPVAWATGKKAKEGRISALVEVVVTGEPPISADKLMTAYPTIKKTPKKATGLNFDKSFEKWSGQEARGMLQLLTEERDGKRDQWLQIGMALNDGGYDFSLFNDWSESTSIEGLYNYNDCVDAWNSFTPGKGMTMGTLVMKARAKGWMRVSEPLVMLPGAVVKIEPQNLKEEIIDSVQSIKFTGLIGDTISDILATSQLPQPELATLNVLSALGAVFGRRYASPMDTRTNLYTVGVASTGAGKDHSRKYIKNLLFKAKLEQFIGDDSLVSGAGLLKSVSDKPSQIMHIDEFGMVLSEIKNKNAANYMKVCSKILTEFYSTSSGYYRGGQYADPKREPIRIAYPNLCIYGTTTLNKYIDSLDKSVIESGEINRYIIIKAEKEFPDRVFGVKRTKPSQDIIDRWAALVPMFHDPMSEDTVPIQVTWEWLDDKTNQLFSFQDKKNREDKVAGALWARYAENVIKIAMISAICRNQSAPNMELSDIEAGEVLVKRSVEYMIGLSLTHMYDSEHERICNKILEIVKSFGEKMSKKEISNRTRELESRVRDGALQSLEERGAITIEADKSMSGRISHFITAK